MNKLSKLTTALLILCMCGIMLAPMLGLADEAEYVEEPVVSETAPVEEQSIVIGTYSDEVMQIQQVLASLGYLDSVIDGYFGSVTEAAVMAFQANNGLYVDGVAGPYTLAVLFSGSAVPAGGAAVEDSSEDSIIHMDDLASAYLTVGIYGSAVSQVQQKLNELGYALDVDGYYGNYTASAVADFQSAHGLYVDGEAGPLTIAVLFDSSAAPADTGDYSNIYLTIGSYGQNVVMVQTALARLGFYTADIDGDYGSVTANAVWAFQLANGLYVDGEAGPETLAVLLQGGAASQSAGYNTSSWDYSNVYLVLGAQGDSVVIVQKMLAKLGYYTGDIDGDYGSYTVAAVRAFQEAYGLYADGEAGPQTIGNLVALAPVDIPIIMVNTTLSEGMTGDEVTNLQKRLSSLGYRVSVNGTYDAATAAAVRQFQLFNELSETGNVDESTRSALNTGSAAGYSAITQGTINRQVAVFQNLLNQLGYNAGPADGVFGLVTKKAVREFQLFNNITPDGVINDLTIAALLGSPVSYNNHTPLQQSNTISVAPYGNDSSRLLVTWTEVPGADGYYLFRSKGSSGDFQLINITETAQKYVDWGLDPSTSYSYYVLAYTGNPLENISDKQYIAVSNTGSGSTPEFNNPYLWENYNVPYYGNTVYASSATDAAASEIYQKLKSGQNFYLCVNNGADPYTVFYGLKNKVGALNDIGLGFVSIDTSYSGNDCYFLIDAETYNYMFSYISMAYKERMEEYGIYLADGKSADYFYDHHTETSYDNDYIASYRDSLFETPYGTAFRDMSSESKFLFTTPGTNMVMRTDYMIFDLDYNTVGESAIDIIMKMANKKAVGVCRHFALAVDTVCDYLDIPCWTPVDYGYNHQWAIVQTRNNSGGTQYYLVDNQNVVALNSENDLRYRPVAGMIWDYTPATRTEMGDAYPW